MRSIRGRQWLVAGALAAGLVAASLFAWRGAIEREHRREIEHGRLRPVQSRWMQVGNLRLHVRVALPPQPSYSPPIVLLHGFGASSSYFIPTAERLAHRFTVYAPDLPGHGKSDTPPSVLDVPQLADALVAWMDVADIERACLMGNSMGCQVAVETAVRHPDRVDRLVLIGPTVDPDAATFARLLGRFLRAVAYEQPSLTLLLAQDYARMGLRLVRELRVMRHDRIETKLPHLTVPVMLVRGEKDPIAPPRWLARAAQLCNTNRIAVIPGWGHAVNYSAPQLLVEAITPFLFESWQNYDRTAAGSRAHPPA